MKKVHFPTHWNQNLQKKTSERLVGFTGDGRVVFTEAGRRLAAREMSVEESRNLSDELSQASYEAGRVRDEALGLNQWIARPLDGCFFEVTYHGHVGRFKPIRNGRRRVRFADPSGQDCTVCRREMPEGATMYVFDRSTERQDTSFDETANAFRHHRACETCMRPELSAALLGAALIGKKDSEES